MSRMYTILIRISLSASVQTPVLLDVRVLSPLFIGQSVHTNLAITKLAFAFCVCLRIYIQYQYLQCFLYGESIYTKAVFIYIQYKFCRRYIYIPGSDSYVPVPYRMF